MATKNCLLRCYLKSRRPHQSRSGESCIFIGLPSETTLREIACARRTVTRRRVRTAAAESCHRVRRPSVTVRTGYSLGLQGLGWKLQLPSSVPTRSVAGNSTSRPLGRSQFLPLASRMIVRDESFAPRRPVANPRSARKLSGAATLDDCGEGLRMLYLTLTAVCHSTNSR
jgi:hypothetical protein